MLVAAFLVATRHSSARRGIGIRAASKPGHDEQAQVTMRPAETTDQS